jgi:hypothetical protein
MVTASLLHHVGIIDGKMLRSTKIEWLLVDHVHTKFRGNLVVESY